MGDIADMMLEGAMCEQCGEYLGEGDGSPRLCGSCGKKPGNRNHHSKDSGQEKVQCTRCERHIKAVGLPDHMRDKHGVKS